MKSRRGWRFVTPRFLDERAEFIQLQVIRDAFLAIMALTLLFSLGFIVFHKFMVDFIGLLLVLAIVAVGMIALLSTIARGGWDWQEKRASAKGNIMLAPLEAVVMTIVIAIIDGKSLSLLEWLFTYISVLVAVLLYPFLILAIARKKQKNLLTSSDK